MKEFYKNLTQFVQTVNNMLKDGVQLSDFPEDKQERIAAFLEPIVSLHDEVKAIADTLAGLSSRLEAVEKVLKATKKTKGNGD